VITRGAIIEHLKFFWDECSTIRHFFANRGLCKHKGEMLDHKEYFRRFYEDREKEYESVFKEKRDG